MSRQAQPNPRQLLPSGGRIRAPVQGQARPTVYTNQETTSSSSMPSKKRRFNLHDEIDRVVDSKLEGIHDCMGAMQEQIGKLITCVQDLRETRSVASSNCVSPTTTSGSSSCLDGGTKLKDLKGYVPGGVSTFLCMHVLINGVIRLIGRLARRLFREHPFATLDDVYNRMMAIPEPFHVARVLLDNDRKLANMIST